MSTRTRIPELDLARTRKYVEARVPPRAAHQVRLEVEIQDSSITIIERRAPWRADIGPEWTSLPIARLGYSPTHAAWTLFWCDRNLHWHRYDKIESAPNVDPLLAEIEADPTAIFWG